MTADRGSASVYVLAAAAVVLLAGEAGATVGSAVVARHRAASAADLGALAAAARVVFGPGSACVTATRVVHANGARLDACRFDGPASLVTASAQPAGPALRWGRASVSARAGPVGGIGGPNDRRRAQ